MNMSPKSFKNAMNYVTITNQAKMMIEQGFCPFSRVRVKDTKLNCCSMYPDATSYEACTIEDWLSCPLMIRRVE